MQAHQEDENVIAAHAETFGFGSHDMSVVDYQLD